MIEIYKKLYQELESKGYKLPLSLLSTNLVASNSDDSYSETLIFSINPENIYKLDIDELEEPIIDLIKSTYYQKSNLNWEQHSHDWQVTLLLTNENHQIYQYFQITLCDCTVYINHLCPNI